MATRQRPGRTSGKGSGSKTPTNPKVTPLHPEPEASNTGNTEDKKPTIVEAARELIIPFGAPMQFYYDTVAPLIHSYNYDWRLEELQVQVTADGNYLTTYAVHLSDSDTVHMGYDKISVSAPQCDPIFSRFIADRAFMCSFLKVAEAPPPQPAQVSVNTEIKVPDEVFTENELSFGSPFEAPEEASDPRFPERIQSSSPAARTNSITVEYSASNPPRMTLNTQDPQMVLAEQDAICEIIENFTSTCINDAALKTFWENNEPVLMFIRDADMALGKRIGVMFGNAQRRLNG